MWTYKYKRYNESISCPKVQLKRSTCGIACYWRRVEKYVKPNKNICSRYVNNTQSERCWEFKTSSKADEFICARIRSNVCFHIQKNCLSNMCITLFHLPNSLIFITRSTATPHHSRANCSQKLRSRNEKNNNKRSDTLYKSYLINAKHLHSQLQTNSQVQVVHIRTHTHKLKHPHSHCLSTCGGVEKTILAW